MRRFADRRGATALEFAVSILVVLTLAFATFDLAWLFATQHAMNYGVEKAVRYAVVNSASATTATIKSQFVTAVTPVLGATKAAAATVQVSFSPSEKVGGTVTVTASVAWTPMTPFDSLVAVTVNSSQTLTIQH
jgi:Flp pilus assembly protein TadG